MFSYPKQAEFNRVVPKKKIYAHAKPSKRVADNDQLKANAVQTMKTKGVTSFSDGLSGCHKPINLAVSTHENDARNSR